MSLRKAAAEAFFLPAESGERFCLFRQASPKVPFRGGVLFAHPFAEEMNKSRRAVAVAATTLAEDGWSVLQIDFLGCGDSSGDLADARWENWQDDLIRAAEWLETRGIVLKVLWGLRAGALLAAAVVERVRTPVDLLFWQPVLSGAAHLTQFLRLKAAEQMLGQSSERSATARLRAELETGNAVEVGGYTLSPHLALAIDSALLAVPAAFRGQILWFETGRADVTDLSPLTARHVHSLVDAGHRVTARAVAGAAFWQTVEIEESPALTGATVAALGQGLSQDGAIA